MFGSIRINVTKTKYASHLPQRGGSIPLRRGYATGASTKYI